MPSPDAVLFDLDDTLVDHSGAARRAVVAWASERDRPGTAEQAVADWESLQRHHYERYQRRETGYADQRRARVRDFLPGEDLADDEAADSAFAGYRRRYEAAWRAFPDAAPAVRRVREGGAAVAVLTNGDHAHQALKLEQTGLGAEVDVLVASSTLTAAKPAAVAFHEACARIGVEPAAAVMVGDSLEHDVRGALAAGLGAVWLDRGQRGGVADVRRVVTLDDLFRP